MAQAGQGGGAGVGPFGYFNDELQNENNQNDFPQPAILDSEDSQAIDAFFNNPESGSPATLFGGLGFGGIGTKTNTYKHDIAFAAGPTTFNTTANMVSMQGGSYSASPSSQRHMPQPVHTADFLSTSGNHAHNESSEVMNGAHALSTLAAAQDQSSSNSGTTSPDGAASWGNMFNLNVNPGAGGAFGAPPRHSRQPSTPSVAQNQHFPIQHVADWQYQAMLVNQQQHYNNSVQGAANGRPREHHSLDHNLLGNPFSLIPNVNSSTAPSGSSQSRPPLPHFGSDPNVRPNGYAGHEYSSYVDQKGGNLINVPMADQAASKRDHMQPPPGGPMSQLSQRTYLNDNIPNGSRAYHNTNTSSSRNMGEHPMNSPLAGTHMHVQNWAQVGNARYNSDDAQRKRRKSQMEQEDESEFTPAKIGLSISKQGRKDTGDDELETPENKAKRRKSTADGMGIYSGSPGSPGSDNGSPGSKNRRSKSRANLSEKEKRQNHILSEQRRRNVIKTGYADLDNLVPVLNGGKSGLSKADALKESIMFLENTVTGNEFLMENMGLDDSQLAAASGVPSY